MIRQGEPSPALLRFEAYERAARSLEEAKAAVRPLAGESRRGALGTETRLEDDLDAAWEEVGEVGCGLDDLAASVLASHFLWLMPWEEAASSNGVAIDKAKKLAYGALEWLDAGREESDE